jgi:hypothetical protein
MTYFLLTKSMHMSELLDIKWNIKAGLVVITLFKPFFKWLQNNDVAYRFP